MSQEYFYNPLFIGRKARLAADKIVEVERGAIAMGVVRGVCALCGNDRELQDSHLLPKAVYRYVRANTDVIRSPIIVDSYSARNTDRQFTEHLLCRECEQRFSRNGEAWMMLQIYRGRSSFPLLTALDRYTPVDVSGDARLYAAGEIPEIDLAQLTYFALSVFWRAAATDWRRQLERLHFGEPLTSGLRDYLLGKANVPDNIALVLHVCDDPGLAATTLANPVGGKTGGYHSYVFIIPGLAFHLYVGKRLPVVVQHVSFCGPTKGLVLRSNYEEFVKQAFLAKMQTARPSAGLVSFVSGVKALGTKPSNE